MKWLVLTTALLSFVLYGHAIQKLFSRDHGVDARMKALQVAGTVSAIGHLWAIWSSDAGMLKYVAALALYAFGICLFFLAKKAITQNALTLAFSPDTPKLLLQRGIYARIRHPFYAAYTITWLAGVVAAPSLTTALTTALMFSTYWLAAQIEERKFASSPLAEEYSAYRSKAGMFWPR